MFRLIILSLLLFSACNAANNNAHTFTDPADYVVRQAISASGGEHFDALRMAFDFRDNHFTATLNQGHYILTRSLKDDGGNIILDRLDNEGFIRKVNGSTITLPDSMAAAYAQSVNSVHYFVQLPYRLKDPAVRKELIDTVAVKGERYYKILVSFDEERGGEDFRDVYLYWFHAKSYSMDYLAYTFDTDEGGMRFREAFNRRQISGITFQDYINLKPPDDFNEFLSIDSLYENNGLTRVSVIENKNIQVSTIDDKK